MAANLVMEEREELMVSPNGSQEYFRTAHFLTPSVTSIDGPVAAPTVDSLNPAADFVGKYKDLPFKVNFLGWKHPKENWKTWVDRMHSLHHSTWKKAGVFDAIMNSKCTIHRCDDLIFGFVDKWCPMTNSFMFPWGEATITLEDMIVLGGYSALGELVSSPPGDANMEEKVKKLQNARSRISKSPSRKATQSLWITKFMGSKSEIEHEAFLAYWLSKFVFPLVKDTIGRNILSIAVQLASGTKIALAPAVLALIYKDLARLKAALTAARKSGTRTGKNNVLEVTASAPLALVQVWIWERFPLLRPKPNPLRRKEPRLARWDNVKKLDIADMLPKIDSAEESFQWRPYVSNRKVYMKNEYWALVDSELDEDIEELVRCLRASELVGLEADCIEHYLPHRVAMQFGMDQDLPGHVSRINVNPAIAWSDYCRPIRDVKLYIPARVGEPGYTTRHLTWWKKLSLGWRGSGVTERGVDGKKRRRFEGSEVDVKKEMFRSKLEDEFVPPPPGFPPMQSPLSSTANNGGSKSSKRKLFESSSDYNARVSPPDFARSQVKASDSSIGIQEIVSGGSYGSNQSQDDDAQGENHLSSTINNGNTQETMLLVEHTESEAKSVLDMKIGSSSNEVNSSTSDVAGLELEQRIMNVEKLLAWIKEGKIELPLMKNPK